MSIKKTLQNKNKKRFTKEEYKYIESVSYTHLTLPTSDLV